jgi:hypothetical protein
MRCLTTSIIFNWYMETLVNRIAQDETTVTMEYGYGLVRTIHLNAEHPSSIAPSRAGHSIGRWDGDVLVVDTVGFLPGMLALEVAHGDGLHVVERFALNSDGSVLTRDTRPRTLITSSANTAARTRRHAVRYRSPQTFATRR